MSSERERGFDSSHHTVGRAGVEEDMYVHHLHGYTRGWFPVWNASQGEKDGMPEPILSVISTPHGTVVARQGREHLTLYVGKNQYLYWQRFRYHSSDNDQLYREATRFAELITNVDE